MGTGTSGPLSPRGPLSGLAWLQRPWLQRRWGHDLVEASTFSAKRGEKHPFRDPSPTSPSFPNAPSRRAGTGGDPVPL